MSVTTLAFVKRLLRVTHSADDVLLQELIDAAESEAIRYLGTDSIPRAGAECPDCTSDGSEPVSDSGDAPQGVLTGVALLVQADYEGVDADEMERVREQAFKHMRPWRCGFGV